MIVIAIIAILAAIMVPNYIKSRAAGYLAACEENLRNMATACELYAADNKGLYPSSLNKLSPKYLQTIPTCPGGAPPSNNYLYNYNIHPSRFVLCCRKKNHKYTRVYEIDGYHGPSYAPHAGGLREDIAGQTLVDEMY